MQLKTIFNRVTDYKPFVVEHVVLIEHESQPTIEISMRARENGLPSCSGCGKRCSRYDTQPTARRFDFIPLWMIPVMLVYTMRRVNCPTCGVKVEQVPWSKGKSPLTTEYQWFLAGWARRMSWKEVAGCFQVSWDHVYNSVKHAVSVGIIAPRPGWRWSRLASMKCNGNGATSIRRWSTKSIRVANACCGSVQTERPKRCFASFVFWASSEVSKLQFVCSDMWQAYLKVIAKKVPQAIACAGSISRDAEDEQSNRQSTCRRDAKQMREDGYEPLLDGKSLATAEATREFERKANDEATRFTTVQLEECAQPPDERGLSAILGPTLIRLGQASFLVLWCTRAMRSKIEPMKKMAKTLRSKRELLVELVSGRRPVIFGNR